VDAIYSAGVVAVLALVLLIIYVITGERHDEKDPADLALLRGASEDDEVHAWVSTLRSESIWAEMRARGDRVPGSLTVGEPLTSAWNYEVWVRASDLAKAREILGMHSGDLN
jgi:hypothetical protein